MQSEQMIEAAALSDRGCVRSINEDFYECCCERGLFVVCDGMGGAAGGEIASRRAAEAVRERLCNGDAAPSARRLEAAICAANRALYEMAEREPALHGMGTTLVALLTTGRKAWIANVGDSRCYLLRGGCLTLLTKDHSLVAEQVRLGQLTAQEANGSPLRNVITRAVGIDRTVASEISPFEAEPGDLLLLCTDGLTREVPDDTLAQLLRNGDDLEHTCETLIMAAKAAGGHDNITCLLVRYPAQD
ncbi:MAG: Stp1/IreP family PP2C-type Ser/Thr phosphatase [Acidobacteria bacterium]|nr:Stp1/IreP family PP2C-type Ser/Thr phosphatase [Acidobacteriota bacterium]MBW4043401.1 Stp1/IreP family PP2C-type Ser/Thr phosphatase [Acidobacteriota bacterium]